MNTLTKTEKKEVSSFVKNLSGNIGSHMTDADKEDLKRIEKDERCTDSEAFYRKYFT